MRPFGPGRALPGIRFAPVKLATKASAGAPISSAAVPDCSSVPSTMTPISSASAAASSKSCVTTMRRQIELAQMLMELEPRTLALRVGVERRERLVEQEHVRVACERAGEPDALALASRELARPRVAEVADPEPLEHRVRERAVERAEADVLRDVEVWEERVLLEEVADAPPLGRQVEAGGRVEPGVAVDGDRALARRSRPATTRSTVVLPAPDGPTSARRLAARDGQPDGRYEGAKGMGEVEFERHRENELDDEEDGRR